MNIISPGQVSSGIFLLILELTAVFIRGIIIMKKYIEKRQSHTVGAFLMLGIFPFSLSPCEPGMARRAKRAGSPLARSQE